MFAHAQEKRKVGINTRGSKGGDLHQKVQRVSRKQVPIAPRWTFARGHNSPTLFCSKYWAPCALGSPMVCQDHTKKWIHVKSMVLARRYAYHPYLEPAWRRYTEKGSDFSNSCSCIHTLAKFPCPDATHSSHTDGSLSNQEPARIYTSPRERILNPTSLLTAPTSQGCTMSWTHTKRSTDTSRNSSPHWHKRGKERLQERVFPIPQNSKTQTLLERKLRIGHPKKSISGQYHTVPGQKKNKPPKKMCPWKHGKKAPTIWTPTDLVTVLRKPRMHWTHPKTSL